MSLLENIRCFVLDMDGTVYLGDKLLPGSLPFMHFLQASGRDYLFLTNNSSRTAPYYAKKLTRMGWQVPPEAILTSGEATALYIRRRQPGARMYLVGTPDLEAEMISYGFMLTASAPDFVIVGFDTTLNYEKLVTACNLVRAGVPYIATHPDLNCPTETGYIPDCGSIIALIKASTGIEPHVIGKPHRDIIDVIFDKKPYRAEEMAIVGDRLYTDILTGHNAGITSILVLTGESSPEAAALATNKPDYIFSDLAAIAQSMQT